MIAQISDRDALPRQIDAGALTFYIGIDPTGSSLHCGHLVPLYLLIALARRGNKPIVVIGDGTARIGDPSGKSETRALIDSESIARNADAIEAQVRIILERFDITVRFVRNGEWLNELHYIEFLRAIGSQFSVNHMLSFESFKRRLAQQQGLSFIEFNYMLLQAYDFLILHRRYGCALQIGGDDQWGNVVAGIDLIRRLEQQQVYALTTPLIVNANGEKMGKTAAGALFVDTQKTSVFDYYQYWRNIDDRDVVDYLLRFTDSAEAELPALDASQQQINAAKMRLAREMTRFAHGDERAETAARTAERLFGGGGAIGGDLIEGMITVRELLPGIKAIDMFAATSLCASKAEARRLIQQGGAQINNRKVDAVDAVITMQWATKMRLLLRAGKKRSSLFILIDEAGAARDAARPESAVNMKKTCESWLEQVLEQVDIGNDDVRQLRDIFVEARAQQREGTAAGYGTVHGAWMYREIDRIQTGRMMYIAYLHASAPNALHAMKSSVLQQAVERRLSNA